MRPWDRFRSWARGVAGARRGEVAARPAQQAGTPPRARQPRRSAYQTLLVPLDGSQLAECALPFARRLAALTGARLVLVRAVAEGESEAAEAAALASLEAHADVLREGGVHVDVVVPTGAATEAIAATVAAERADLIVMTTSGRFLLGQGASGLFAGLLSRAAVPILLVREWYDAAALGPAGGPGGGCIVVPLDGSPLAERALAPATDLAALLGRELLLVRAVPAAQACVPTAWCLASPEWVARQAADADRYLRGIAAGLAAEGVVARSEVRAGSPVAEIHGAVREHGAALLALATHGESGLGAMPLGGVARQVLWEADAPVVLVHPALNAGAGAEPAPSGVPVVSSAAP